MTLLASGRFDPTLLWTGGVAVLFCLLAAPIFARLLPFGLDGRMAATIMGADRWNAGAALMAAQSPEGLARPRGRGGAADS